MSLALDQNHLAESFIKRWQNNAGGAERANYAMFLTELCDVIDVARPDPASHETEFNEYAFERGVTKRDGGERVGSGRIDLYKRGSFVLEAKQSRWKDGKNAKEHKWIFPFARNDWQLQPERCSTLETDYDFCYPVSHG